MTTVTAGKEAGHAHTAAPTGAPVSSFAMLRTLGGVAALSGLLLALTYQVTFERIQHNKREALRAAVFTVLPGAEEQRAFELRPDGTLAPLEDPNVPGNKVYAGYQDGGLVGVAIEASGQGYADVIRVLYGYDPVNERVVGMKVLETKETPGLGDKIMKAPFTENFAALDVRLDAGRQHLVNPITVVKSGNKHDAWEIDGITGATISSKAIGKMLQESAATLLPTIQSQLHVLRGDG
jgi:Na+-translocating ferredoxin:NAD+ oxidoreductase subunit G